MKLNMYLFCHQAILLKRVYEWVCTCVHVCTHAGQRTTSGVILRNTIPFLWDTVSHWPGIHQFGYTGWIPEMICLYLHSSRITIICHCTQQFLHWFFTNWAVPVAPIPYPAQLWSILSREMESMYTKELICLQKLYLQTKVEIPWTSVRRTMDKQPGIFR